MINYTTYEYGKMQWMKYALGSGAAAFGILMLFYNQCLICLLLSVPAAAIFLKVYRHPLAERQRWMLTMQFRDAMESMVSAVAAGYSLENAMLQTRQDLLLMYEREDVIVREFDYMIRKMEWKMSVEMLWKDLGSRSGVEDIITFGEILVTARRTGGNLANIMRRTATNISEKIEIRREIETLIAGKKMESKCMTAIPLFMIVYLRVFSPGFLNPLYHNLVGIVVMTGALAVYVFAFLWGQRIMKIEF